MSSNTSGPFDSVGEYDRYRSIAQTLLEFFEQQDSLYPEHPIPFSNLLQNDLDFNEDVKEALVDSIHRNAIRSKYYMAYVRAFFALPFLAKDLRPAIPTASHSNTAKDFRDVIPICVPSGNEELKELCDLLHDLIKRFVVPHRKFYKFLRKALSIEPDPESIGNEATIQSTVQMVLKVCVNLFNFMGLDVDFAPQKSLMNPISGGKNLRPDFTVSLGDVPLLLVEVKPVCLEKYYLEGNKLKVEEENVKMLFRQCNSYMHATKLNNIVVTDFYTTIVLEWDIIEEQAREGSDAKFESSYRYQVIRNSDIPGSLQVVVTSMILRQLGISVLRGDIKEEEVSTEFMLWLKS